MKFSAQLSAKTYDRWQKSVVKSIKYCPLVAIILVIVIQISCVPGSALRTGEKLVAEKNYPGAVEAYQSVVDAKPGTPEAFQAQLAIGKLFIDQMNQPAEGIKAYEAVIAAAPGSDEAAEAYYELGMHY